MLVSREKENLIITFEYNPVIIEIVKQFDSRKYNSTNKEWIVPIVHVKKVLDTLIPLGFSAKQDVRDEYDRVMKHKEKVERILASDFADNEKEAIEKTGLPLFNFQKIGTAFLCTTKSALLADEPGLGKSIQSLAVTIINNSIKNLIVCPSTLKLNWSDEILKWIPDSIIFVVSGSKKQRNEIYEKAKKETKRFYLIINYELLLRDVNILREF